MASTYDLTTTRGQVRLTIGDTSTIAGQYVFEDEEIDYFLTEGGTVQAAAIEALRVLLTSKAHRIKRATVNGLSIDDTAQVAAIQLAIRELGGASVATITGPSLMPSDADYTA